MNYASLLPATLAVIIVASVVSIFYKIETHRLNKRFNKFQSRPK